MTTAREIMTGGPECVGERETLLDAARKMKELDVGSAYLRRRQPAQGHSH